MVVFVGFKGVIISAKYGGLYNDNYNRGIMGIMQDCAELCFISFLFGLNRFPMATLMFNRIDPHCHFLGRTHKTLAFQTSLRDIILIDPDHDQSHQLVLRLKGFQQVNKTLYTHHFFRMSPKQCLPKPPQTQGQGAQSIHAQHFQTSKLFWV